MLLLVLVAIEVPFVPLTSAHLSPLSRPLSTTSNPSVAFYFYVRHEHEHELFHLALFAFAKCRGELPHRHDPGLSEVWADRPPCARHQQTHTRQRVCGHPTGGSWDS